MKQYDGVQAPPGPKDRGRLVAGGRYGFGRIIHEGAAWVDLGLGTLSYPMVTARTRELSNAR